MNELTLKGGEMFECTLHQRHLPFFHLFQQCSPRNCNRYFFLWAALELYRQRMSLYVEQITKKTSFTSTLAVEVRSKSADCEAGAGSLHLRPALSWLADLASVREQRVDLGVRAGGKWTVGSALTTWWHTLCREHPTSWNWSRNEFPSFRSSSVSDEFCLHITLRVENDFIFISFYSICYFKSVSNKLHGVLVLFLRVEIPG